MMAPGRNRGEIRETRASIMFLMYWNSRMRSPDRGQTLRSASEGRRLLAFTEEYLDG